MPDRREGITRAMGIVFARIDTSKKFIVLLKFQFFSPFLKTVTEAKNQINTALA